MGKNQQQQQQLRQRQQLNAISGGGGGKNNNNNGNVILDSVTNKELQDLQLQYQQTNREYASTKTNLMKIERESKLYQITKDEMISNTTTETNCYESIGKIFLKTKRDDMIEKLDNSIKDENKKYDNKTSKLEYLERKLKLQQTNIQELVQNATSSSTSR